MKLQKYYGYAICGNFPLLMSSTSLDAWADDAKAARFVRELRESIQSECDEIARKTNELKERFETK